MPKPTVKKTTVKKEAKDLTLMERRKAEQAMRGRGGLKGSKTQRHR